MADSNRVKIRYARETAWGETPATPASTELKVTGESLEFQKQTVVSDTIRADGQRDAVLEVGQSAQGAINYELAWSDFEPFFETALRGTIASARVTGTFSTAASSISGSTAEDFTVFEKGQWIRLNFTGHADDNAVVQVSGVTSTVLSITGSTLAVSAVFSTANIHGRTLKVGNVKTSYFVEGQFEEITAVKYFNGMRVDSGSLEIRSAQIVTGVFNFQGKQSFVASTTQASSVVTSAGTNTPMTAAANVGEVRESGAILSTAVEGITFNFARNMRARPKVGSKFTAEHGDGGVDVTGNMNVYLEDITLMNRLINHTTTELSVRLNDENNNTIVVTVPALKFTAGSPSASGTDQEVFVGLDFTGFKDSDTATTIRLDFLPV